MNAFPLAPFLSALAADGIRVSFDDYDRISTVLGISDKWTLKRLRGVLTSLLAHNSDQAERLQRRFDIFFPELKTHELSDEDVQRFLGLLRVIAQEDSALAAMPTATKPTVQASDLLPQPEQTRRRWWIRILLHPVTALLLVSLVLLAVVIIKRQSRSPSPSGSTAATLPVSESPNEQPSPSPSPRLSNYSSNYSPRISLSGSNRSFYGRLRVNSIDPVKNLPLKPRWGDFLGSFSVVVLLIFGWVAISALISKALQDPAPRFTANGPRLFQLAALGDAPRPMLDGATLDRLADSINYFLSARPSKRLNIQATINATGQNAGMPALRFYKQRQVRRVCVFEDLRSEALRWSTVTSELLEGLSKRGVDVWYARFPGSPVQFITQDNMNYWLDDLDNESRDSLFLFFSDGKHIGKLQDRFALERLATLPLVAWFDFREPKFWNETAYLIKTYGIPVYQANADGLKRAFDHFLMESGSKNDEGSRVSQWRGFPPFTDGQVAAYVEHLLGDSMVWAQACAMIQPISLNLAHTLRHRFQPHLPAERIERLSRLPGTTWEHSCLRFSREVVAALRGGFSARLAPEKQDAILSFIQQQIRRHEPPKNEHSLRRLAWEWTLRRVQLESAPDEALPVLSRLSSTPLGAEIRRDLSSLVFVDQHTDSLAATGRPPIPLRTKPSTREGIAYLKELSPRAVMTRSLAENVLFSWQRFIFVMNRLLNYLWLSLKRVSGALSSKAIAEASEASREQPNGLWAEPPELRIKRVFAGQTSLKTFTLKSSNENGIVGHITTDNDWLACSPEYCDEDESERVVKVFVNTHRLNAGKHSGNITFVSADNREALEVPVQINVYRSWQEVVADWWRKHRPKHPVQATLVVLLVGLAVVVFTIKVLPANWINRLHNHPPTLNAIKVKSAQDLPDNMLALETDARDADGDALEYSWSTDWGKIAVGGTDPILIAGSTAQDSPTINLGLTLRDASGGYTKYSSIIQLGESDSRDRFLRLSYVDSFYRDSWRYSDLSFDLDRAFDYPSVESLLANLRNGTNRERWIAATTLGPVRQHQMEVTEALINSLNDPDADVRQAVIATISRIRNSDQRQDLTAREELEILESTSRAVPQLINQLQSNDQKMRLAAAEALGAFPEDHQVTVPKLIEALKDKNAEVASGAAESLGLIGSEAAPALINLLRDPTQTSQTRRSAAMALAGPNMTADSTTLSALTGSLNNTNDDLQVRCGAAYAIAQLRPKDATMGEALVLLLKDKRPQVRSAIVSALWSIFTVVEPSPSVVNGLFEAMKDENAEVRRTALGALTSINQPDDASWERKLLEALKDSDSQIRHDAAMALARRSDPTLVTQLIATLQDKTAPRDGAAWTLGMLDTGTDPSIIPALIAALTDPDLLVRQAASYGLVRQASEDEKVTEALLNSLSDSDPHLKNAAISAVWSVKGQNLKQKALDSREEFVTKELLNALNDQSTFVRQHAAITLGFFAQGNEAVTSALTNAAKNDRDGEVAEAAVQSLQKNPNGSSGCTQAVDFLDSRFAEIRLAAVRQLRVNRKDSPCMDADIEQRLMGMANDTDGRIRVLAAVGLSRDGSDVTALMNLTRDPTPEIRIIAAGLVAKLASGVATNLLREADPRVRREVVFQLGRNGGQDVEPYLKELLEDPDQRVAEAARCALIYIDLRTGPTGLLNLDERIVLLSVDDNSQNRDYAKEIYMRGYYAYRRRQPDDYGSDYYRYDYMSDYYRYLYRDRPER